MDIIYWLVRSSSMRIGVGVLEGWMGGIVILASCVHHFIRIHENQVKHSINIILFEIDDTLTIFQKMLISIKNHN